MEQLVVTILNWEKYNPRKDVKRPSWFRFEHDLFESWQFFDFTHSEFTFWVYLLCQASHRNEGGVVTVNSEHAHRVARIPSTAIKSALQKLKKNQVVEVRTLRGRYVHVQDPYSTRRDVTVRNETERDVTEQDATLEGIGSNASHSSAPESGAREKIAYYCDQWKAKYKANYSIIPKEAGLIKNSFKNIGLEKFKELVDAYLDMHEAQFISKRHDITSLALNVAKVSHFAQTGVHVSRHAARSVETQQHNEDVFKRAREEIENEKRNKH